MGGTIHVFRQDEKTTHFEVPQVGWYIRSCIREPVFCWESWVCCSWSGCEEPQTLSSTTAGNEWRGHFTSRIPGFCRVVDYTNLEAWCHPSYIILLPDKVVKGIWGILDAVRAPNPCCHQQVGECCKPCPMEYREVSASTYVIVFGFDPLAMCLVELVVFMLFSQCSTLEICICWTRHYLAL